MIILINPNLVVQRSDPFTTGIVYMPIGLAYIAASLRAANIPVKVIDAFAEQPYQARQNGNFLLLGLNHMEIIERIPDDTRAIFVYAINLINHLSTVEIVYAIKQSHPNIPVVVVENTQTVTAYSLHLVSREFYDAGADYILTGEGEHRAVRLAKALLSSELEKIKGIDGVGSQNFYNSPCDVITNLDNLPFPAWDLFPLQNYWKLRFAHGPQSTKSYLPLLTSRGCPFSCRFCVAPYANNQKWRSRSSQNVVDEIEFFVNKYNVQEFHIEDMNPTVSDQRIRDICNEILKRNLKIIWKIVAGTKVETIKNEETIDLMAKSGCKYISISPETGSSRLLELMHKPFDLKHALSIIKRMNQAGIYSQACFVLGFPDETDNDRQLTHALVRDLTRWGVDEIALFIITPVPGAAIYENFHGFEFLSELNFSPSWRTDYHKLNNFRLHLYTYFLLWKFIYHPFKILKQPLNFLRRNFNTKMEMIPYRALVYKYLDLFSKKK
ncbi:B12-binding domain-containing radical SAM protein [Dissulfurispira thermophila]|uniref:B12-binding domain-containing radical SAM protein n=1 Tax=Dissulfurispira thermophila TaxID=2715679 RepID=A0A7G1H256_9BACT|nr:radical SAM protein [Dissulfurispira thermophila]BCB96302.1 B12-binding domain-containing radical SAM protein [Dissulfurispira thermophila]